MSLPARRYTSLLLDAPVVTPAARLRRPVIAVEIAGSEGVCAARRRVA